MRDHTQLRVFELADEVVLLVYRATARLGFLRNDDSSLLESKVVETEKVLNGLIRALRDHFSLQPEHLSRYEKC